MLIKYQKHKSKTNEYFHESIESEKNIDRRVACGTFIL